VIIPKPNKIVYDQPKSFRPIILLNTLGKLIKKLDFSPIGGSILHPKESWKYLGFIFDRKLTFYQHIDYYLNKAISLVKCMKLLENSSQEIDPIQKRLLYKCCVLPITLYSFQLWFYNKAPLSYHMKILEKMQRKAAIWILGAFKTSSIKGIETITGIIPIKFYLQKLARRSQIRSLALLSNHLIRSLMDDPSSSSNRSILHSINTLTN